jgi:hypothetical protein
MPSPIAALNLNNWMSAWVLRVAWIDHTMAAWARSTDKLVLKIARWLYRKRLRELIARVPADIGVEILAASDNITGPGGDVNLNWG